jgi:hypothetical protein
VRVPAFVAAVVLLTGCPAPAQTPPPDEKAWSFSASAYTYIVPDDRNYVQPTLAADRGWLHLAARYNYEDLETGSVWLGYNFSGGENVAWAFTPMFAACIQLPVSPPADDLLSYWRLNSRARATSIDARSTPDSFFYNWSELSISPVDWLRAGAVIQRTRVYKTDRDVQRGLLVGVTYKIVDFTTYVFNPDDSKPIVVLGVTVTF